MTRSLIPLLLVMGCTCSHAWAANAAGAIPVDVVFDGASWQLLRNGEPYVVQGGGWGDPLDALQAAGGNSIRTWGVDQSTGPLLDAAEARGMTVMVGLWMRHVQGGFDYGDPEAVATQQAELVQHVIAHRDHPAVLAWGIGNEVEMGNDDPLVWQAIESLAAAVKIADPQHPTVAVTAELGVAHEQRLETYCPSIDIWGINSYESLGSVPARLAARGYDGPYLVTEYGPRGSWAANTTPWNAPFEQTSREKAAWYESGWTNTIAANHAQCLGGYTFVWAPGKSPGDTWFELFTWDRRPTAAVDAMWKAWTGTKPKNSAPDVEGIQGSIFAATLQPGESFEAEVVQTEPEGEPVSVEWFIARDEFDADGAWTGCSDATTCLDGSDTILVANAPMEPGNWRLFAFVADPGGRVGTASMPFQVAGDQPDNVVGLPFMMNDHYIPSGWMGDTSGLSMQTCDSPLGACGGGCHRFQWTPSTPNTWVGVLWQYPVNNWGTLPGLPIAKGATEVAFTAWSDSGTPTVTFRIGSNADGFTETTVVELDDTPREYVISLEGMAYDDVTTGFGWVVGEQGPGMEFSISDVEWRGQAAPPECPADFNDDGIVNGADLALVLAAWGTASPRYDLDDNGLVNGADLALVLAAWGPCPTG